MGIIVKNKIHRDVAIVFNGTVRLENMILREMVSSPKNQPEPLNHFRFGLTFLGFTICLSIEKSKQFLEYQNHLFHDLKGPYFNLTDF